MKQISKLKILTLIIILLFIFSLAIPTIITSVSASQNAGSLEEINILSKKSTRINDSLIQQILHQVDTSILYEYIRTLQGFGPHPTGSAAIELVGNYLFNEFESMNISVINDPWLNQDYEGRNIIATLQGITDSKAYTIVCAHYDTVAISPGADDDGSGVAAVLMLASIMKNYSFNTTIKFILFSGEEQGCLGSRIYAQKARENNDQIIGVLALDKIGYAVTQHDGCYIRHHANQASYWMIQISQDLSKRYKEEINLEVVPLPEDPSSDHIAFTDNGYKGSNLVENTLNPTYHTSEDLLEYMNMSYLTNVCKLGLGIVSCIAELKPIIDENDIGILAKGTHQSTSSQLTIIISNQKHIEDTANVTITIAMKHMLRGTYVETVKDYYHIPCSWNFSKEIIDTWSFFLTHRRYTRGFFILDITVTGRNDDIYLYKNQQTYGLIIRPHILLLRSMV